MLCLPNSKKAIYVLPRWFFLCLLLLGWLVLNGLAVARDNAPLSDSTGITDTPALAVGDWVFRQGTSLESYLIASFGAGDFSHIGIVVEVEPEIQILHATTDDLQTLSNQVLLSTWQQFTDVKLAKRVAVARPLFLSAEQRQNISRSLLAELGKPFVLAARDKQHLYCTTILADAIQSEYPAFNINWSWLEQPLLRGEYLHPEAFAAHHELDWVLP